MENLKYDFFKNDLFVFDLNEEMAKMLFQKWIKHQPCIDSNNVKMFMRNTTGGLLILDAKYKKEKK